MGGGGLALAGKVYFLVFVFVFLYIIVQMVI